ncbi:MAG: acylphosphatase [Acidobacteriota bacterium]
MAVIARSFVVHGRVQGVGFRYFTADQAQSLSVTGWVKNLPGGEVEVYVEGPEEDVATLLSAVRRGPRASRVDRVDVADRAVTGRHRSFQVTL